MNFQNLSKIEDAQFYIDLAFRYSKERAELLRQKKIGKDRLSKSKTVELERVTALSKSLFKNLNNITKNFPSIDSLPPFYNELVKITMDYNQLKKSLGAIGWASKRIIDLEQKMVIMIKKTNELSKPSKLRREFFGRAFSFVKQVKTDLLLIDDARKIMKAFPAIKTSATTVVIAGFPNVGKSTLLKSLTTSKPKIRPYPFTTLTINLGYLEKNHKKIQIVDTPGALDRPFNKLNPIEQLAFLVLKHLAEKIIFVFDPTESCGYSIKKQVKLFKKIKEEFKIPIITIANKSDMKDQWLDFKFKTTLEISAKEKDTKELIKLL